MTTMTTNIEEINLSLPTPEDVEQVDEILALKRAESMGWDPKRIIRELGVSEELIARHATNDFWWIDSVLDKGYLRIVDWMGTDLSVANAARTSFKKESFELTQSDARIINFLGREQHTSPFRHCFITIEMKTPLMVARQWWKYVTGAAHTDSFGTSWNENSGRYITMEPEFYIPENDEWRTIPDNRKQGSGGPVDRGTGGVLSDELEEFYANGHSLYLWAMEELNIAPEMARLFLPAYGLYVTTRWSVSLQGLCYFLAQRMAEDAQHEIAAYANKLSIHALNIWPLSSRALLKGLGVEC